MYACLYLQKCTEEYNEDFASGLKSFLSDKRAEGKHLQVDYQSYINDHLKYCETPPCCVKLW